MILLDVNLLVEAGHRAGRPARDLDVAVLTNPSGALVQVLLVNDLVGSTLAGSRPSP